MIYVDSNVFIYAVGRSHPLKTEAQNFFLESSNKGKRLATSAEVLHELLHVYLPVKRMETLDAAMELATKGVSKNICLIGKKTVQKIPPAPQRFRFPITVRIVLGQ